jgi:hypothetical protein
MNWAVWKTHGPQLLLEDLKRSVEGVMPADSMQLPDQLLRCFGRPSKLAKNKHFLVSQQCDKYRLFRL